MAFENATAYITDLVSNLSLSNAAEALQPLVFFLVGMVIYSIFVFKFYKFIARRDIFRVSKGGDHSKLKKLAYALEYIFLFPVIAFFWPEIFIQARKKIEMRINIEFFMTLNF